MKNILALLALVCSLQAAENYVLDTVEVNSSAVSSGLDIFDFSLENQSRSVSIISKEELLKSTGAIQNVLASVPGIVFSRSGGINGQITTRGLNSNLSRSIVAVDGVLLTGRNTLEFNTFDPNSLDAVEIIRGPASSLYGSNAMNGVINFKSRRYKGDINKDFSISSRLRSLEFASVNSMSATRLEALGGGNGFDVLFGLSLRRGSDYSTPLKKAKNSSFKTLGFDFNTGYTNDESTRYYLQGKFSRVTTHRAGGLAAAPGSEAGIFMREDPIVEYYLRAGVEGENLFFADEYNAYMYWRHWDTDIYNDRRNYNGAYVHQQVYNNNYLGSKLILSNNFEKHKLIYGLEYLASISPTRVKQEVGLPVTITRYSNRASQTHNFSAFVKDDIALNESLLFLASLRGDYSIARIGKKKYYNETPQDTFDLNNAGNITNKAITGSLGLVYHLNEFLSVFSNLSHNFKAPQVSQMMQTTPGGSNQDRIIANTKLKSEYSQSAELGTRFESDVAFVALTAFYTQYTDMIKLSDFYGNINDVNNRYKQYINLGKANIQGLELEGFYTIHRLKIAYNLSTTYGKDETNDRALEYIAPLYGKISLNYKFDWGYLEFAQRAYKGKTRINAREERKTKSYTMSDLYANIDLGHFDSKAKDMNLLFGVENLFNTKGRNPVTAEDITYARTNTNPLYEPGVNVFVKFAYQY